MRPTRLIAAVAISFTVMLAMGLGSVTTADHNEGSQRAAPTQAANEDDPLSAILIFLLPAIDPDSDAADLENGCRLDELLESLGIDPTVAGPEGSSPTFLSEDACAMLSTLLGSVISADLDEELAGSLRASNDAREDEDDEDVGQQAILEDDEDEALNDEDDADEDSNRARRGDEDEEDTDSGAESDSTPVLASRLINLNVIIIPMVQVNSGAQAGNGSSARVSLEDESDVPGSCTLADLISISGVAVPVLEADGPNGIQGVAELPDVELPVDICTILGSVLAALGADDSSPLLPQGTLVPDD